MALIIGVKGACRCQELHAIKIQDVQDLSSCFLVTIPTRQMKFNKEFIISGNFYNTVKKYINLRPSQVDIDSFFLNYQKEKCTRQRVGVNKFAAMGKHVALFLNKPHPELHSGHAFQRSAISLCNTCVSKEHDGKDRKSTAIAEESTDNSSPNTVDVPQKVVTTISSINTDDRKLKLDTALNVVCAISLNNCSSCVINVINN